MPGGGASVPWDRYPEMDWQAVDKVAAWRVFKKKMEIIFVAESMSIERRYAIVLVALGDEAFNCWQTLQSTVNKPEENLEAFWDAFEKSFEQTTTHWHYIDMYLSDF